MIQMNGDCIKSGKRDTQGGDHHITTEAEIGVLQL